MSDRWSDRLSEYLDGGLGPEERRALEAHIRECEECTSTLSALRRIVAQAEALDDRAPENELWSGIAERLAPAARAGVIDLEEHRDLRRGRFAERRLSFSVAQLAAASIALMVLSAGTAWLAARSGGTTEPVATVPGFAAPGFVSDVPVSTYADETYGVAIAELERIVIDRRESLDTATVRIIEENLMTIDRAIAQARRALAEDPASSYLNDYLAGTMRQKLEFLRQAAAMAGAAS